MRSALVGVVLVFAVTTAAQPTLLHVYVYTASGEPLSGDVQDRLDTVVDIKEALTKTRTVIVTTNRRTADLLLEVTDRTIIPKGRVNFTATIEASLTVGTETVSLTGDGGDSPGYWGSAAKDIAKQVQRWIKDNAARIPRTPKEAR